MRHRNRKKFLLPRGRYDSRPDSAASDDQQTPDIINIWQEQKRLRAEAVQLEKQYELAKLRVKQLQIQIKQRNNLLSDSDALHTTLTEDISRTWQNIRLWIVKTYKQFKLRLAVFYLRNRLRLGIPLRDRTNFRREKIASAILLLVVLSAGFVLLRQSSSTSSGQTASDNAENSAISEIPLGQSPQFDELLPNGKTGADLGGFAKISPEGSAPVYAYADEIGAVKIRVSQQELPSNIKRDSDELEKLAHDFNANRTIFTAETTVYIGESIKGPQSLIFQKNGLLILINSDDKLSDDAWKTYIQSLAPAG